MIILKPTSHHYKLWCDLVLLTLHRYALVDHILSDAVDPSTYWAMLDNIVVTWILDMDPPIRLLGNVGLLTKTARQVWLALEAQYLGNCKSHVLQLDAKFCVFKQGDLSVSDYSHKMKGHANDLCALGETIIDCHLVLNRL
jgi:hypothetical protein